MIPNIIYIKKIMGEPTGTCSNEDVRQEIIPHGQN